jgi:hypothetical protein
MANTPRSRKSNRTFSKTSAVKHNGRSVCDAIYGRQKTAYGYVWKIQED